MTLTYCTAKSNGVILNTPSTDVINIGIYDYDNYSDLTMYYIYVYINVNTYCTL